MTNETEYQPSRILFHLVGFSLFNKTNIVNNRCGLQSSSQILSPFIFMQLAPKTKALGNRVVIMSYLCHCY